MDDLIFDVELEQISTAANEVLEMEPSLTRYEALQLARSIIFHDRKEYELDKFHSALLTVLESIKNEMVHIKTAIYESV